jgi:hypothetical protein
MPQFVFLWMNLQEAVFFGYYNLFSPSDPAKSL